MGGYCQHWHSCGVMYNSSSSREKSSATYRSFRVLNITVFFFFFFLLHYSSSARSKSYQVLSLLYRWSVRYFRRAMLETLRVLTWQYISLRYSSYCDYWQDVIVRYRPYCEHPQYFDSLCLYDVHWPNFEYVGVLPVLLVISEDTASIGVFWGICIADMLPLLTIRYLAGMNSTLILQVLAAPKYEVYTINTTRIFRVRRILRWAVVHNAVRRLASVDVSLVRGRTNHQLLIDASEARGLAVHQFPGSLYCKVWLLRSHAGIKIHSSVNRRRCELNIRCVFNQVWSRVWDDTEKGDQATDIKREGVRQRKLTTGCQKRDCKISPN